MTQTLPKVLIADDDRELVFQLERSLSKKDLFSLCFVDSAEREIKEAKTGNYDFILTDLQMPEGEEGIEAIREIRKFNSTIPIVMHTIYENQEIWNRALEAGANEVISKCRTKLSDYTIIIQKYLK